MAEYDPGHIHAVLIVGAGFGGIGMAISLQRAGITDFLILERGRDVGGVWRDNGYPGAACDVPSHLYSYSFEPNPDWPRRFASRDDIYAYLQGCARKHGLETRLRLDTAVAGAVFDESKDLWRLRLADGTMLAARVLVSATGQLSNPALPRIEGLAEFRGPSFHSARWDHGVQLAGKRVAVIGTGASATQFVPQLAAQASRLLVFQRSPSHIIPRPDRPYSGWRQALFRAVPWTMRLHRARIYAQYETRALGFTRAHWLRRLVAGGSFRRLLARQVPDPVLRARLTPDYPVGCKRILVSSDYLPVFSRPNVELVTEPIVRIAPTGIETGDGRLREVDAIVYGTGSAATQFLAPMRIVGRGGVDLNTAWRDGAAAYLGLSVPGFPNFFMLYGPNTNLGHNSIVYMLESQFAHVLRALDAMRRSGATAIEVEPARHRAFQARVRARLAHTAWVGCRSWYLDEHGRNTVNWPGFSLSYRWLTRHASLAAYRYTRHGEAGASLVLAPASRREALSTLLNRGLLRAVFRPLVGPPLGLVVQRRVVDALALLMPAVARTVERRRAGRCELEIVNVHSGDAAPGAGAILYLHGGAFCLGSPWTHRGLISRLARAAGLPVWAPDYRRTPAHPYPAALDDALASYEAMLASGLEARRIGVAADSAGAMLALALVLRLRTRGLPLPSSLALLSPLADLDLADPRLDERAGRDPMVRKAWLEQALAAYACPPDAFEHRPLVADLAGLPPLLVQAGSEEILLPHATRLAAHARACGVHCRLEIYEGRWHMFQMQGLQLHSARCAIDTVAAFLRAAVGTTPGRTAAAAGTARAELAPS